MYFFLYKKVRIYWTFSRKMKWKKMETEAE